MEHIPVLETSRLLLRPWKRNKADARDLYTYAKDYRVGPAAGWQVHKSPAESLQIIRDVLTTPGICAVVNKQSGRIIGAVGLTWGRTGRSYLKEGEAELGYWIGVPNQRKGYAREAAEAMISYAFTQLQMEVIWCGYYEGNVASRGLQEKLGFVYHHAVADTYVAPLQEVRTEHFTRLDRERWVQKCSTYNKD